MSTALTNFKSCLPPYTVSQDKTLAWLEALHQKRDPEKAERINKFVNKFGVGVDKIKMRRSFIEDFINSDFEKNTLFSQENSFNPSLFQRSSVAQESFQNIFKELFSDVDLIPDHLFHVSCTHYESPSAAQKLILDNQWPTISTHLYHMGCYAALPAIRTANAFALQDQNITIAHSEICSLHLNADSYSPEQLVVQSLFADGAIRYNCIPKSKLDAPGLEILSLHEIMVPKTQEDMTWKLHHDRFDMTLSKNVPKYLGEYLEKFMQTLFEKAHIDYKKEKAKTIFAIHPGGPKIIDQAQELLELSDHQVSYSKEILSQRGNMSAATLPHIWELLLKHEKENTYVATVAFGPGLTMTGALLKVC